MHWLLIGYMFLFIHRPFEFWTVLGDYRIERVYMLMTLLVWAVSPGKRWLGNAQHAAYALFAGAIILTWGMSPYMDQGQQVVEDWFKIVVFYLLLVTTVSDEKKLRQVVLGFVVVMAVYELHSFREYLGGRHVYRMGISRMVGVDTTQGDPNSFGASIVFGLPFVSLFWHTAQGRLLKWFVAGFLCLSVGCILLTGSRSSFLGMLLWMVIALWQTQYRYVWFLAAVLCGPLLFVGILPDSLQTRFETIVNPDVGPENAKVSGYGRLEGLFTGLEIFQENPISGVGPGAWRPATGMKLESHNLYGQIAGETGALGLCAFVLILACFWVNLRWMRQMARRYPEWKPDFLFQLSRAVGMGLVLLLVMGNFGHNLFRHNWLWYGGFLIIAVHCARERLRWVASGYVPPLMVTSFR